MLGFQFEQLMIDNVLNDAVSKLVPYFHCSTWKNLTKTKMDKRKLFLFHDFTFELNCFHCIFSAFPLTLVCLSLLPAPLDEQKVGYPHGVSPFIF